MVTGGAGFLGRYVVQRLRERGAHVHVADVDYYDLRQIEEVGRAMGDCSRFQLGCGGQWSGTNVSRAPRTERRRVRSLRVEAEPTDASPIWPIDNQTELKILRIVPINRL